MISRLLSAALCGVVLAACAPPASKINMGPSPSVQAAPSRVADLTFRPGNADIVLDGAMGAAAAQKMQRQEARPPDRSRAALNRELTAALSGTTIMTGEFNLFLSPSGAAGYHKIAPRFENAGRADQWYVNQQHELCLRDMTLMTIRTPDGRPPRRFGRSGWCLEIAEIDRGRIVLGWGSQKFTEGTVYVGDAMGFAELREKLRALWQAAHG